DSRPSHVPFPRFVPRRSSTHSPSWYRRRRAPYQFAYKKNTRGPCSASRVQFELVVILDGSCGALYSRRTSCTFTWLTLSLLLAFCLELLRSESISGGGNRMFTIIFLGDARHRGGRLRFLLSRRKRRR